jgi:hypothetical protein
MPGAGRDANRVAALRSSGASGPIEPGRAAEDVKEPDTPDAGWHRGGRPCKRAAGHIRGDGAYFPRVTGAARHTGDPRTARHFTVIARGCYCPPLALPATGIALHSHCAGRGERGRAGRDAQCHTTPCHTTPRHATPRPWAHRFAPCRHGNRPDRTRRRSGSASCCAFQTRLPGDGRSRCGITRLRLIVAEPPWI